MRPEIDSAGRRGIVLDGLSGCKARIILPRQLRAQGWVCSDRGHWLGFCVGFWLIRLSEVQGGMEDGDEGAFAEENRGNQRNCLTVTDFGGRTVLQLATSHISGSDLPWLMALHAPEAYKVQVRTTQNRKAGLFGEVSFSRSSSNQPPHQRPPRIRGGQEFLRIQLQDLCNYGVESTQIKHSD